MAVTGGPSGSANLLAITVRLASSPYFKLLSAGRLSPVLC